MNQRTCKNCDTVFAPQHSRQVYCTAECRQPEHKKYPTPCTRCGVVAMKYPSNRCRQFCGTTCRDSYMRENKLGAHARVPAVKQARPPVDLRSDIRRAVEAGDSTATIAAIRARCIVDDSGCWLWQGKLHTSGYASMNMGKRSVQVHRLSLEAKLGQSLGKQPAHHMCANAQCVNPDHLQPVTHHENAAEMMARTYMVDRIRLLEQALHQADPMHALLAEVSVPEK